MKNLLIVLILLFAFARCSQNEEHEDDNNENIPGQENPIDKFNGYQVSDTSGLVFYGENKCDVYGNDIYNKVIAGLKHDTLWIGVFDSSKKEIFSWLSNDKFQLHREISLPYGQKTNMEIKKIRAEILYYKDIENFYINLLHANGDAEHDATLLVKCTDDFVAIKNGKTNYYQGWGYYRKMDWIDGHEVWRGYNHLGGSSADNYKCTMFSPSGEIMYDVCDILNDNILYQVIAVPINLDEGILLNDDITRTNIKTNQHLWSVHNSIFTYKDIVKLNYIKKEYPCWTLEFNILTYEGNEYNKAININIETGDITEL